MKSILNLTVSATGSPSEVRARITDQVQLAAGATAEHAAAMSAMRAFIERAIDGVSEDDTLAVSGTVTISVADAPPVVQAKRAAEREAARVAALEA